MKGKSGNLSISPLRSVSWIHYLISFTDFELNTQFEILQKVCHKTHLGLIHFEIHPAVPTTFA